MAFDDINIKLNLDTAEYEKGLNSASNKMKNFSRKLKSFGSSMTKFVTLPLAAASAGFLKMAVDAEETQSKFNTVFKGIGKDAVKMQKNLVKNYGLSTRAAQDLLSGTGDLLTGFGFTKDAALELSNKVQELSVDMASFTNLEGGAERASNILTKALLGERDALVSLGVKVSEVDLKQRMAEKGLNKLTGSAKLAARAQVTYELIMEQAGNAAGDYGRTQDSTANKIRKLKSEFEDIGVELGTALLPILNSVLKHVKNAVDWWNNLSQAGKSVAIAITGIVTVIGPLVSTIGTLTPIIIALSKGVWAVAKATWSWVAANAPIIGTVTAVIALVAAFALQIKSLADNFDYYQLLFKKMWLNMKLYTLQSVAAILKPLLNMWMKMQEFQNWVNEKLGIKSNVKDEGFLGEWLNSLQGNIDNIKDELEKIPEDVTYAGGWKVMWNGMVENFNIAVDEVLGAGSALSEKLKSMFSIKINTDTANSEGPNNVLNITDTTILDLLTDEEKMLMQIIEAENERFRISQAITADLSEQLLNIEKLKTLPSSVQEGMGIDTVRMERNATGTAIQDALNEGLTVEDALVQSLIEKYSLLNEKLMVNNNEREKANTIQALAVKGTDLLVRAMKGEVKFLNAIGQLVLQVAMKVMQAKMVEAMANLTANESKKGVVGIGLAAAGIGILKGLFSSMANTSVPALAQGGIAYGPTMAMVGDNRNAGADPEVIAPLSKLKNIIGAGSSNINVNVTGIIEGENIRFITDENNRLENIKY